MEAIGAAVGEVDDMTKHSHGMGFHTWLLHSM
jgi:hypothetical protein